jgi:hypothetical protein
MTNTNQTAGQTLKEQLSANLIASFSSCVQENIDGITDEITASADGKLSLSVPIKLQLTSGRIAGCGQVSYSRKFSDEFEFITEDPHQQPLGIE